MTDTKRGLAFAAILMANTVELTEISEWIDGEWDAYHRLPDAEQRGVEATRHTHQLALAADLLGQMVSKAKNLGIEANLVSLGRAKDEQVLALGSLLLERVQS